MTVHDRIISALRKMGAKDTGLGDILSSVATPIARVLRLPCVDRSGKLKPDSRCAKRRDALNRLGN